MQEPLKILVTGASGYVGGRLVDKLQSLNYQIKCLARAPDHLVGYVLPTTQLVQGDVLDRPSLVRALRGADVAYYLIHSMGTSGNFSDIDRKGAINFASAASECGVKRIIYLGGLGTSYDNLSEHLKSRQEVGNLLRNHAHGVQVIELRASIVIGSGSLSFEMIKALVERLPVMITPKWVWTMAQPIAINDLLEYLIKAIDIDVEGNPVFEIGGSDRYSYGQLMEEYARQKGLKRTMIPVPVLSPRLSSLWLGLVTPLYARVGRKLVESAMCETVVHDPIAAKIFDMHPVGVKEAITQAIANEGREKALTRWIDSRSSSATERDWSEVQFGGRIVDKRITEIKASPEMVFKPILRIGGKNGWYYGNYLWWMRGLLDLMVGGVGLRRGRRDQENLKVGDVVDFWRVEALEPNKHLRMAAEMKLPGRAWLEFTVEPNGEGSILKQTAIYDPVGVIGLLYWYLLYPVHHLVFVGMLNGISKAAEQYAKESKQ